MIAFHQSARKEEVKRQQQTEAGADLVGGRGRKWQRFGCCTRPSPPPEFSQESTSDTTPLTPWCCCNFPLSPVTLAASDLPHLRITFFDHYGQGPHQFSAAKLSISGRMQISAAICSPRPLVSMVITAF